MAVTRLTDIIEPAVFTDYILQETMTRTALYDSGVIVPNGVIKAQLKAGAHSFTVPFWNDLGRRRSQHHHRRSRYQFHALQTGCG
jgi:hypothetical protein